MKKILYLYVLCFITIISCNNDDKRIAVTGVSLNKTELTLTGIGSAEKLEAYVVPANATTDFEWFTNKPDIAAVDADGEVTALAKGTAIITVITANGEKTANCTVTVEEATIAVTGVSLNKLELVIANIGTSKILIATVEPIDASNAAVEWSSENPAVATVNANGEVTAIAEGTAVITAKTADGGKTATCEVTVVGCYMCELLDPCVVDPQYPWDRTPLKPSWWNYPPDWADLPYEERESALQIPEEILFSLSTEELTDVVLRYPRIRNPLSFNQLQMGVNALYDSFNGIRELFRREDAAKELLKHYNCMMQDIDVFLGEPDHEQGYRFVLNAQILEFLFGFIVQKSDVLSKEDYKRMLHSLVCAFEKEIVYYYPDFRFHVLTNYYARAHVIVKMDAQYLEEIPSGLSNPVFNPSGPVWGTGHDLINHMSYNLIK